MKIALPTRDGRIDDHFGHCHHYTIYTVENKQIISREELPSPEGCGCKSGIAADLEKNGVKLAKVNIATYIVDQTKKGIRTLLALVPNFLNTSDVVETFLKNKKPERKKNIGTAAIKMP